MTNPIRNRIKGHRQVRAGDLVPHEFNFRLHPELQRSALEALYREIGFARSLLAYELPDGRLKLIDGHLRRDIDPEMLVEVEILDVNEDEARALLLSIDPLAELAQTQEEVHRRLLEMTPVVDPELEAMWRSAAVAVLEKRPEIEAKTAGMGQMQFLVLVTCRDEKQQVELMQWLKTEGMEYRALMS